MMLAVKKFILLYHGFEIPNPHRAAAWDQWLQRRGASFSGIGSAFGPGRRVSNETVEEFSLATNPASGFSIVVARHIDAAEQLLEGCPIVDSVSLYEALPAKSSVAGRPVQR